jgi:transposase InsO family protein
VFACIVLDVFARKAVGWAIDRKADTSLVKSALDMAARTKEIAKGSILHADHGPQGQFTAWAFTTNVATYGILLSMGTVGQCFDNAMIEAF